MAANMVNRVVMPGDVLGSIKDIQQQSDTKNTKLRLGPGLRQEKDTVIAFKSGVLRHRSPATYWIDTNQKRVCTILI